MNKIIFITGIFSLVSGCAAIPDKPAADSQTKAGATQPAKRQTITTTFTLTPQFISTPKSGTNSTAELEIENLYSATKTIEEDGKKIQIKTPAIAGRISHGHPHKKATITTYNSKPESGLRQERTLIVTPEKTDAGISYKIELIESETPIPNGEPEPERTNMSEVAQNYNSTPT